MIEDIMNMRNEISEIKRDNRELVLEKQKNESNDIVKILDKLQIQLKNAEKELQSIKLQLKSI